MYKDSFYINDFNTKAQVKSAGHNKRDKYPSTSKVSFCLVAVIFKKFIFVKFQSNI